MTSDLLVAADGGQHGISEKENDIIISLQVFTISNDDSNNWSYQMNNNKKRFHNMTISILIRENISSKTNY